MPSIARNSPPEIITFSQNTLDSASSSSSKPSPGESGTATAPSTIQQLLRGPDLRARDVDRIALLRDADGDAVGSDRRGDDQTAPDHGSPRPEPLEQFLANPDEEDDRDGIAERQQAGLLRGQPATDLARPTLRLC